MQENTVSLESLLAKAQAYQDQNCWEEALSVYKGIAPDERDDADSKFQIALCLYHLGHYEPALQLALESSRQSPDDWRPKHLTALALRMNGRLLEAIRFLSMLHKRFPDVEEIQRDYGDFICKVLGDWRSANAIWKPLKENEHYQKDLRWFDIKQKIYDGGIDAQTLTQQISDYSRDFLQLNETFADSSRRTARDTRGRLRVGLISTFFRATPVYYLCFSALKHLSEDVDLVFYSRESVEDWATEEFKSIAKDWQDVKHLSADRLAGHLHSEQLDVLIDMCGWLDQEALKALSSRPAKRLYKWIGGQSTTTGMTCFDGFLTDEHQSPEALQSYYSEPLIYLDSGYATYTAPAYLPSPKPYVDTGRWQVGVISHPMKVSIPFLKYLRQQVIELEGKADFKVNLQFIGWRYSQPALQKSILRIFQPVFKKASTWLSIQFLRTQGHKDFLEKVSNLDWVIDTFPYTSGVTAMEALALGVPCRTRAGTLFSQRHAYSHCRYAGLELESFDLDYLGAFKPPVQYKTGVSLLSDSCARKDHVALAASLAKVIQND
jgi:tetratricopeptide (TPR) repeat protein